MKIWKLTIQKVLVTKYSGTGYKQGIGFDLLVEKIEFLWKEKILFQVITDIKIHSDIEWFEKLKKKLEE